MCKIEYINKDPLENYYRWKSIDVSENANKYLGSSGFFSCLLEECMKELARTLPRLFGKHIWKEIYVFINLPIVYSLYIP